MERKNVLTKILAVIGTVLVWFPIVATVGLSIVGSISHHLFLFDYLMPLELFPVALVGGGVLLWAAFRARLRQVAVIGWICFAVVVLIGSQAFAITTTGLASGQREPTG